MRRMIHATAALLFLGLLGPGQGSAQATATGPAAAPDTTPRGSFPIATGTLSAKQLGDVIATSVLGGLRGRMAGVRIMEPSGQPGSELRLRLRGAVSFGGSQDPLIVIDGVISRGTLADIAADDVERIEVLRGPSASAIYGSDGAAGVVLVYTRRGNEGPEGKIQVRLRSEAGPSFMTARLGESGAHPFEVIAGSGGQVDFARNATGGRILKADRVADNPYPGYHDHQSQLYGAGLFLTNHLSVAGRKGGTNFAASFDNSRNEGTVFGLSGFRRRNLRVNVDQRLGPVEIALSGLYGWSDASLAFEGAGSPFFAARFLEPHVDLLAPNPDGSPYRAAIPDRISNASNPLYALANQRNTAAAKRLMGGAALRWRPLRWLAIEGSHHAERRNNDSTFSLPDGYLSNSGMPVSGFGQRKFFTGGSRNTDGAIVVTRAGSGVRNTTRIGYAYQRLTRDDSTSGSSSHIEENVKSAYAVTGFIFKDRYVLDAAARRDQMSLLSPATRTQWYYRIGGAWEANQDLRIRSLDELRLHLAYGSAGQRPEFSFGFVPLGTSIEPLRASRTGELEVGASLATRGGRFTLDYAYSRKTTRDVVSTGFIPTTVGYIETTLNAGTLRSTSHELSLGYAVLRRPEISWNLTLTGDRIRQQITEYSLPERLSAFGQQPATFFTGAGKALGVMYGFRYVRTITELYDDPDKKALSGPGQAYDPAGFVVNEEGYVVPKASFRCGEDYRYRDGGGPCAAPERPILYERSGCPATVSCPPGELVPIGNSTPDFVVGLQSALHYKRFGVSGLLDWSQGGDVYNATRQWPFFDQRDPNFDQRGKPAVERKSIAYFQAFYNGLNGNAFFVESGTYLKVRELAVTYEFRLGRVERVRVGLVGRNLFTLSGFSGYDPEVGNTADPFVQRIDWFQYPHFRTISGIVELAF